MKNFNLLASLYSRAGWLQSYLVRNSDDRFSHDKAGILLSYVPKFQSNFSSTRMTFNQGCGNTMLDLSDLVPFHSGQVENFNLLVLGQVQNLYKVAIILYFIFRLIIMSSHVAL